MRALPSSLLNTDRHGGLITSLQSLFHCQTTLTVKKFLLMSSLNLLWCTLLQFPCSVSPVCRRRAQHLPLLFLSSGSCREQGGHLSAFSILDISGALCSFSQYMPSIPFVALNWVFSRTLTPLLYCRAQNCCT